MPVQDLSSETAFTPKNVSKVMQAFHLFVFTQRQGWTTRTQRTAMTALEQQKTHRTNETPVEEDRYDGDAGDDDDDDDDDDGDEEEEEEGGGEGGG